MRSIHNLYARHSWSFIRQGTRLPNSHCCGKQPSDLWQSDAQGVRWALHSQDEGVLVGVLLDDIVIHVHQDPEEDKTRVFCLIQGKDYGSQKPPSCLRHGSSPQVIHHWNMSKTNALSQSHIHCPQGMDQSDAGDSLTFLLLWGWHIFCLKVKCLKNYWMNCH